jgi:predicted esterase
MPSASPTLEPAPRRDLHPGIKVAIEGGGTMNESAPYLVPDDAPRSVTVILHAYCADEIWMCDWLQYGDLSPQWQVCPRAPNECGNGGAQWSPGSPQTLSVIERAVATHKARHGARVGDGLVLAGMSQGAYAIADLVRQLAAQPEPSLRLRGIVLHGARVRLSSADVKKLGIRVALAAGDQDQAAPTMESLARTLQAQGCDAKYESFGPVGHFLPVDTAGTMSKLIAWARGDS